MIKHLIITMLMYFFVLFVANTLHYKLTDFLVVLTFLNTYMIYNKTFFDGKRNSSS